MQSLRYEQIPSFQQRKDELAIPFCFVWQGRGVWRAQRDCQGAATLPFLCSQNNADRRPD